MDPQLIEFAVGHFLSTVKDAVLRKLRRGPDFELQKADGSRILVEVKAGKPTRDVIQRLAKQVGEYGEPVARFLLVTQARPSDNLLSEFETSFSEVETQAMWVALSDLPKELGMPSPGDLTSPRTLAHLQLGSLVSNLQIYRSAPIGTLPQLAADIGERKDLLPLLRQFSHLTISKLESESDTVDKQLRFGERIPQVTVVLSDIVDFSSLVSASQPEELKGYRSRYYRLAREMVFSHHGMLDKFIGDAVLAVFGYPVAADSDSVHAVRFAQELVDLGKDILSGWIGDLNAVIETGTRVGIATGDLWPINIGSDEIEVSLLGDTINLAARLEKHCQRNNILLDNRSKQKAAKEDADYIAGLKLTQVLIPSKEAKGQQFTTRAWTKDGENTDG